MAFKIALLAAAAVVTWILTRPLLRRLRGGEKRLTQCENCGVYHEDDTPCKCTEKSKTAHGEKSTTHDKKSKTAHDKKS